MRIVQASQSDAPRPVAINVAVPPDFLSWYERRRADVEFAIAAHVGALKSGRNPNSRLLESVEYSLTQPGKRLRPILVLEACRACGGADEAAWPAALAIECIHTFSLIHDDLPAMDNDDLRRGRPTNHVVFGDATAILAGDWLGAHAFDMLVGPGVDPDLAPMLVQALAQATASMVVGQAADIDGEQRPIDAALVEFIHSHKTARLIEAAGRMGAISAGASETQIGALGRFGRHLGIAFQIVDDILDETSTAEVLGKRAHKDARESKQTYPAALGMDESRCRAQEEIAASLAALEPFGPAADSLRGLAAYVIARDH
jgi:geranylgeranyl diphosphate synthase type II